MEYGNLFKRLKSTKLLLDYVLLKIVNLYFKKIIQILLEYFNNNLMNNNSLKRIILNVSSIIHQERTLLDFFTQHLILNSNLFFINGWIRYI